MKSILTFILLAIPAALMAANQPGMNQGNMQNMMQVMQQVQECMEQIDQEQMDQLQAQSEQMNKEVESLCAAGKRDEAQKRAMKFSRDVASNPAVEQMRKCGEMAKGIVPMVEGMGMYDEKKDADTHVCDQ